MPQPAILKISEIFSSVQGEGLRQGEPTHFVRLAGCNLKCFFCDTKYAWEGGREMSVAEVLRRIEALKRRFPANWVCLTGGEPLLQDLRGLASRLKSQGFLVQVETNGTFYQPLPVDWYAISPKPEEYGFRREYLTRAKEVKLVVTRDLTLDVLRRLRKRFPQKIPILLQPQSGRKWSLHKGHKILEEALRAGLPNIRLSFQLHRVYGLR